MKVQMLVGLMIKFLLYLGVVLNLSLDRSYPLESKLFGFDCLDEFQDMIPNCDFLE